MSTTTCVRREKKGKRIKKKKWREQRENIKKEIKKEKNKKREIRKEKQKEKKATSMDIQGICEALLFLEQS